MFNASHLRLHYVRIMNWKTDDVDYQLKTEAMSDESHVEYWWESHLDHLSFVERIIFLVVFSIIAAFGVIGNILTLYVVFTR